MKSYIKRAIEPVIQKAAKQFPVVVVTGPRQSGKTTVLKHLFGTKYQYVSLEPPDVRAAAAADPRGFMALHPPPVIFDEVQYVPDLFFYIKEQVDNKRNVYGQYLLSGSQNLLLAQNITETLAGRAAILTLLPLSFREIYHPTDALFPWESNHKIPHAAKISYRELWQNFLRGGYPEVVIQPNRDYFLWQASYVQTYLERDVRNLRQVGDLTQFQSFLRALAARSAQLLNITDLARDLGVAVNTIKSWISVLEATYQIFILRPYFNNSGKRLVKTPKIYFTDLGTLCYLTGLRDVEHAMASPMNGAIMETAVLMEIIKTQLSRGLESQVYFWRTAAGVEVDILVQNQNQLIPIEVKLSATPNTAMASSIITLQKELGKKVGEGYVVHPGDVQLPLAPKVMALPFAAL